MLVQGDALLIVDVWKNIGRCVYIWVDSIRFVTAPGLALEAALKNTKVKLDVLLDVDILLMVELCIRDEICCVINRYAS